MVGEYLRFVESVAIPLMSLPVPVTSSALVAVLGDLGRSPRMLNHARSLLAEGWTVTLAGLLETELPADLACHPAVQVIATELTVAAKLWPRTRARLRLLWQLARLDPKASLVIVQNPPAFPILAALALAGNHRRPILIVDWHNLGHRLLSQAGFSRIVVAVYRSLERRLASRVTAHWTVSSAMADHLRRWLGTPSVTIVPDQPPSGLLKKNADLQPRDSWWRRTLPNVPPPPTDTAWLVLPSSWTLDEANGMLCDAIGLIARGEIGWQDRRRITVIATGRGRGLESFLKKVPITGKIELRAVWLKAADYFDLLRCADAGLCLHNSASGLDLPHKLADMRGTGLPALVLDYGPVLRETFTPGLHGELFRSAPELAAALARLAASTPARYPATGPVWEDGWKNAFLQTTGRADLSSASARGQIARAAVAPPVRPNPPSRHDPARRPRDSCGS